MQTTTTNRGDTTMTTHLHAFYLVEVLNTSDDSGTWVHFVSQCECGKQEWITSPAADCPYCEGS